jgi:hypothetical protein
MSGTATALAELARGVRQRSLVAWLAAGGGGVTVLFGAAAWGARLGWFGQPSWVLFAWAAVLVLLLLVSVLSSRDLRRLSPGWLAGQDSGAGR